MEVYEKQATESKPYVRFDPETGVMEITGPSYDEDAVAVFEPLYTWVEDFKNQPNTTAELNLKFNYFNTSSAKCIYTLLEKFGQLEDSGKKIEVNWFCQADDEQMIEEIEYFSELSKLNINIKKNA